MTDNINTRFIVNDKEISASVPPDMSLMRFLRDWLKLTGTKNGCASGHCGACTVIIDGKATRACLVKMSKIKAETRVETIEGLTKDGKLHPIQYCFIEYGAVQCGYCTPGMIMMAKALLDKNPQPTDDEIKEAMEKTRNLCRCTGYINIIKAVRAAGEMMAKGVRTPTFGAEGNEVRSTQLMTPALEKVTGTAKYGGDIFMEHMLFGKLLWSAHPHAKILNIDTSEAEAMPGVACVVTAKDIKGKNATGNLFRDQKAIAFDEVFYIGDSLASVFAESEEIAAEAVKKIKVDYQVLPAVFSPQEAAKPDAPQIHEKGNLCHHAHIERGDVDEAFKQCAVVIDRDYRTPFIEHGFIEPESGVSTIDEQGVITLHFHTQTVFDVRDQLRDILAMPEDKIHVVQIYQGGSFGGKEDPIFEVHLALGVLKTKRPCKIVLTREESLRVHMKRHPTWIHYKTGADKSGHVLAVDMKVTTDSGCYISLSIDVLENMLTFGAGPYFVPNIRLDGESWFTNNVLCGAMRGFGVNQIAFGLEQNMDDMARALKIDPFMFRIINGLDTGLLLATDHVMEKGMAAEKQTVEAAREAFKKLKLPKPSGPSKRIGWGVASAVKNVGYGHGVPETAGTIIELDSNGDITVKVTHHEYGQGSHAGELKLVANELGVPVDRIKIIGPDTFQTVPTGPTTASRQTFLTGTATVITARALKDDLFSRAAEIIDVPPDQLKFEGNAIVDPKSGKRVQLSKLGDKFVYKRIYEAPKTMPFLEGEKSHYGKPDFKSRMTHYAYSFNTQVAVVEVDVNTGEVKVLQVISANDVGKALNYAIIEGQVHGGVMQGIGFALKEEYVIENGWNLTDSLHKVNLPTASDVPEIIPVIVEVPHPFMPVGVKGFAEAPSMATCPAVMNAIYDAVGVRITSLPAKKEKVLAALMNKGM